MYRSIYGGEGTSEVQEVPRTVSLDEGLSSYNEGHDGGSGCLPASYKEEEEKASEYIKKIFGEELGVLLSECALTKPGDPILFLSDLLERLLFVYFDIGFIRNKHLYLFDYLYPVLPGGSIL